MTDESTGHLTGAVPGPKQFPIKCMFIASLAEGKWHETLITISRVSETKRAAYRRSGWRVQGAGVKGYQRRCVTV